MNQFITILKPAVSFCDCMPCIMSRRDDLCAEASLRAESTQYIEDARNKGQSYMNRKQNGERDAVNL